MTADFLEPTPTYCQLLASDIAIENLYNLVLEVRINKQLCCSEASRKVVHAKDRTESNIELKSRATEKSFSSSMYIYYVKCLAASSFLGDETRGKEL